MALFERFVLLRHSQAGEKNPHPVEDVGRALDSDGMKIAMSLPEVITTHLAPEVIVSSPYKRCLQTVEPLAAHLNLDVHQDERWAPDSAYTDTYPVLFGLSRNTVVCTHGEVIERLLDGLVCAKGGFWIIERRENRLFPMRYVAP